MVIPSAADIESAIDWLKTVDQKWLYDQQRELHSALGALSPDYIAGFQLGVQAGRVLVRQSGELVMRGIDPERIL
jgi:hypothetical protein